MLFCYGQNWTVCLYWVLVESCQLVRLKCLQVEGVAGISHKDWILQYAEQDSDSDNGEADTELDPVYSDYVSSYLWRRKNCLVINITMKVPLCKICSVKKMLFNYSFNPSALFIMSDIAFLKACVWIPKQLSTRFQNERYLELTAHLLDAKEQANQSKKSGEKFKVKEASKKIRQLVLGKVFVLYPSSTQALCKILFRIQFSLYAVPLTNCGRNVICISVQK